MNRSKVLSEDDPKLLAYYENKNRLKQNQKERIINKIKNYDYRLEEAREWRIYKRMHPEINISRNEFDEMFRVEEMKKLAKSLSFLNRNFDNTDNTNNTNNELLNAAYASFKPLDDD
jgi:hypothetical protein